MKLKIKGATQDSSHHGRLVSFEPCPCPSCPSSSTTFPILDPTPKESRRVDLGDHIEGRDIIPSTTCQAPSLSSPSGAAIGKLAEVPDGALRRGLCGSSGTVSRASAGVVSLADSGLTGKTSNASDIPLGGVGSAGVHGTGAPAGTRTGPVWVWM